VVKQACSRTIQTSGANCLGRGAHHRRCAREGLTEPMMPYVGGKLQAGGPPPHSRRSSSGNVVYFGQHFISSLKPLSTSGFAPALLVPSVCFSNLTMPRILMHTAPKPHLTGMSKRLLVCANGFDLCSGETGRLSQ